MEKTQQKPKFEIILVNRESDRYYDTLGIGKQRAMVLMEAVQKHLFDNNAIDEVMVLCAKECETLPELVFTLFKAGEYFQLMVMADDPSRALHNATMFSKNLERFATEKTSEK